VDTCFDMFMYMYMQKTTFYNFQTLHF